MRVRVDVARDKLDNWVKELLSAGLSAERCSLSARLLPNTSALLQTEASATTRGTARAGAWASRRVADRKPASVGRSPTLREETVYRAARSSPRGGEAKAIDLSQSLQVAPKMYAVRPTITPGARIWIVD